MPDKQKVNVTAAKGRPMLTWVGKQPLSHVTAFPAQHVETHDAFGIHGIPSHDAETGAPPVCLRRTADRGGPAGMQKNVYSEPSALMHRLRTCTIRGWIKLFERAGNGTRTRRVRHPVERCR